MIPINLDITTVSLYLLMCLAGDFKRVILTFIIIILHETGHIIFLKYFQVPITKLTIYPFGGLIKTNKLINFSPLKELLISIGGILNQLILYLILFNIIPIYPLDGYIILNSIFNIYIPYLKSNILSIIISIITLIIFILYSYNCKINSIFVISFLLYKLYIYLKEYKYIHNKFILERMIYDIPYSKIIYKYKYSPYYLKLNKYYYFNYKSEKEVIDNIYKNYLINR